MGKYLGAGEWGGGGLVENPIRAPRSGLFFAARGRAGESHVFDGPGGGGSSSSSDSESGSEDGSRKDRRRRRRDLARMFPPLSRG